MKKYLFGFAALVLAISLNSFSLRDTVIMKYKGLTFTEVALEQRTNWQEDVTSTVPNCEAAQADELITCSVEVPADFVDNSGLFKTGVSLTAITDGDIIQLEAVEYDEDPYGLISQEHGDRPE